MIIFVASAISVILLAVICYGAFKDASLPDKRRNRPSSLLLGSAALSIAVGCISDGMSADMLMVEIMPSLVGMNLLLSQQWGRTGIRPFITVSVVLSALPVLIHLSAAAGLTAMPSASVLRIIFAAYVILDAVLFIVGIARRLRDVRMILKTGTLWANVGLAVEAVHMVILLVLSFGYVAVSASVPDISDGWLLVFPFLLGGMLASQGVREADDVMFVFWRRQECRIVESMKLNKVETASDPSCIDDVYQDIYERVVAYFEAEKPFLDNELTINDLVKVLYSNKLYISRAISQFTGRNFCQFVNYHRVVYSMELFRANPDMKIHELASGCGFNSDVSYNMAFRLFMGETPGEWCRKERNRRLKMKK